MHTVKLEILIAAAPSIGDIVTPNAAYAPAATGISATL